MKPAVAAALLRALRLGGRAAVAGGGLLTAHGAYTQFRASKTFLDMIRDLPTEPYWKLRLTGKIPLTAKVITDPEEMADYMLRSNGLTSDSPNYDAVRRVLLKQFKPFADGTNAAYIGHVRELGRLDRPVFFGSEKGMNPSVAAHETGHARAAVKYGPSNYLSSYAKARTRMPRPGDMLERNLWDNEGTPSVPAVEREAWDMAPGTPDPKLRDAALDTYRVDRTGRAKMTYGGLTTIAGVLLRAVLAARRR